MTEPADEIGRKEEMTMFSTGPKYVGLDGQPVASRPSFWDELLGYKPQYQTAPTTSDAGAKTTKTRRPGKAK